MFAGFTIDSKTFTALPTDGVTSRHYVASNGATSLGVNDPTNYSGVTGSLNLPPPPSGDFNGDENVDAADYVVWRKTDGTQAGYNAWQTNFGETVDPGLSSNATAPEPGSALNLLVGVAIVICRRR